MESNIDNLFSSLTDQDKQEVKLVMGIVTRRKDLGYSQRELAKITGLKQSTIARIERDIVIPRLDTFMKITDALELDIVLQPKRKELTK